jgi:alanyl-tRNA synthetase
LVNPHELREAFLRYFEERGHRRVPGAPIVPPGDPTLLFTSAGMVQFKPYFTGQAEPPSPRMVSVQKCFRTSDIESVGDPSHLTFFEMLGNFSVGDYFKAEAIPWAHEFLTQTLGLPLERLWPAVFQDDDEAFDLWRKQGFAAERIMRYGEEDNYWFSGDVGPCGPDSEIHYDFGEQFGCGPDCHPAHGCPRFVEIWNLVFMTYYCDGEKREPLPKKNIDTGSGLERVMSVLLHNSPGWDKNRLPSVYDTEVFAPMIRRIEQLSGKKYGADEATDRAIRIVAEHARAVTFLIGDERTPVIPSNEERGYVCRRMLRRAVYFGRRHLGIEFASGGFMADLANTVVEMMRESYPELERQRQFVADIIAPEEQRFDQTLHRGLDLLLSLIKYRTEHAEGWRSALRFAEAARQSSENSGAILEQHGFGGGVTPGDEMAARSAVSEFSRVLEAFSTSKKHGKLASVVSAYWPTTISGEDAFLLHDTYGFPIDLTRDIAEQNGFTVDIAGFEAEMAKQRDRARASAGGAESVAADTLYASLVHEPTQFTGYQEMQTKSRVVAILLRPGPAPLGDLKVGPYDGGDGQGEAKRRDRASALSKGGGDEGPRPAEAANAGDNVEVFLGATPLYPEGGGQVGDRGEIVGPHGCVEVLDTQRVAGKLIVQRGRVTEGSIAVGDEVTARVDAQHRGHTKRNHTATHLLHAALRQVIGPHVRQAGSLVAPDHLRFDFTHTEAVTLEQLAAVESLVNEKVRQDVPVHTRETSFDEAMGEGVLAFFGDKYGDRVRVVEVNTVVPRFSAELCGGTHCERTGEIGAMIITGESSIGSGMRRIEALTGEKATEYTRQLISERDHVATALRVQRNRVSHGVDALLMTEEEHRKRIEKLERSLASAPKTGDLAAQAVDVNGVRVLAARVDAPSVDALRFMGDSLRKSLSSGAAVLGGVIDDKPMFLALVTKDLVERGLHAGNLLKRVAAVAGGSAGGRPDMAQGGGKDVAKLDEALAVVPDAVREMLGG